MQDASGSHPVTTPLLLPVVDAPTDAELIASARAGDAFAFTRLWRRHEAAASTAAAATPGRADVEQVVGAAAALIAHGVRAGGGPSGAARPYVLAAVREAAATADGRAAGPVAGDPPVLAPQEWYTDALPDGMRDGVAVSVAYSSLPVSAQEALWLAEVDGRTAAEIAAELGLTLPRAEGLLVEARAGLDTAWAVAVAASVPEDSECARILARRTQADRATERLRPKVRSHLEACATCRAAVGEASVLARRLMTMLPILVLGGAAGTAFLEATRPGSSAAALDPVPAIDDRAAGRAALVVGMGGPAAVAARPGDAAPVNPSTDADGASTSAAIGGLGAVRRLPRRRLAAVVTAIGGVAATAAVIAAVSLNGPLPTAPTGTPEAAGSTDVAAQAPDMQPPVVVATEVPPDAGDDPGASPEAPPPADADARGTGSDAGAEGSTDGTAAPAPAPAPSPSETPSGGDSRPGVSPGTPGDQELVNAPGGPAPGSPIQADYGKPGANGWRTLTLTGTPGAAFTVSDGKTTLHTGVLDADGTAELAVRGSTANLSVQYGSLALTAGVDPASGQ